MALTDKIISPKEWREERKRFQNVLSYALHRQNYKSFDKTEKVVIPKNVREAYFELFADSVDKKSIQHGNFRGDSFLESEMALSFYGRDSRGANFVLTYLPKRINLEISNYSFNGQRKDKTIAEIGLFSTGFDKVGNLHTNLRVGNNFVYHSGYIANHSISEVIDKIQKSNVIPSISIEYHELKI